MKRRLKRGAAGDDEALKVKGKANGADYRRETGNREGSGKETDYLHQKLRSLCLWGFLHSNREEERCISIES